MTGRTPQQAYTQLQQLARAQQRTSQQLFELYAHERFLARLAQSPFADRFVLKGGMLLAVLDLRRPTRDADMLALGIDSDEDNVRAVVSEIASTPGEDGVSFDVDRMSIGAIRENAGYGGVRVTLPVRLGGARLNLKLDISFGDPAEPERIVYPTLLDDRDFELLGYSRVAVVAEKAATMMSLADANTRDRDFGDTYLLSEVHTFSASALREALQAVADHRGHEVQPLGPLLRTLRERRQQPWEAYILRAGLSGLPEHFADVVDGVVAFVDPLIADRAISHWNPATRRWE